ncbi:hypothetical protein ACMG7G_09920, partial [Streptococcus agalactiae]
TLLYVHMQILHGINDNFLSMYTSHYHNIPFAISKEFADKDREKPSARSRKAGWVYSVGSINPYLPSFLR